MDNLEDISPELLSNIQDDFRKLYHENDKVIDIINTINEGRATYNDVYDYAYEIGEILSIAYNQNLSAELLPNGQMYYNIAQKVINPTMTNNYNMVLEASEQVQNELNKKANLGIKAVNPSINQDRIDGIINRISSTENFNDISWILDEPIKNFSQSVVDDYIKANADFHRQSGLHPVIVRKAAGGCCDWCTRLAGVYNYPEDAPKDIFRRHNYCRCTTDYDPRDGKVQNVHSKEWRNETEYDKKLIEYRKSIGNNKKIVTLSKGKDVTDEYTHNRYPKQGSLIYDEGYNFKDSQEEINIANWIFNNLGGEIRVLKESTEECVKTPDYIWNDKFWELKSPTTAKAIDNAVRKGISQIGDNPGGIILNVKNDVDEQEIINYIEKRVKNSANDKKFDILIIKDKKLFMVIRY